MSTNVSVANLWAFNTNIGFLGLIKIAKETFGYGKQIIISYNNCLKSEIKYVKNW